MACETGLSKSSVQRLWSAHDLKPHRVRGFKLSKDLRFEEKFWDVVGLYLNPPEQALVLCSDEKSQCQALERTQPGLPLGQGHIRTQTHDYYRHGTVTLFAALDYLSGKVFAHTAPRHRHQEWLAFLRKIDKQVASDLELHIICDNYSTHKHAKVTAWLKRHPRFHIHFIPTSSSWLNLVERFFGEITRKVIRPGSFRSVAALVADIFRFLDRHNLNPKPYRWTADPKRILEKLDRAWEAMLEEIYNPIYGTLH
jgi:transposase